MGSRDPGFCVGGVFLKDSSGEQTLVCEGCGSKWRIIRSESGVVARLVECPLCELKEFV
jgi:hypothetical protein